MKDQPTTPAGTAGRKRRSVVPAQLRARFAPSHSGGAQPTRTIRVPEIIAIATAALLFALAAGAYFFLLVPERERLVELEKERAQLQAKLRASSEGVERNESTEASVGKIVTSLSDFETTALASRDPQTTTAVISELNEKTRRHNLARAQFSFSHLDEAALGQTAAQQTAARAASASKRESVFPAIDISLTIEGPYANLRRFIRDIEQSRRFIVINGIQLEGVSETGDRARAALVSLRLDMSVHFRRSGAMLSGGATAAPASTSQ
ncbi:MAG TPA: GspMb/PilO family protein [Pyrinomonadaceae bacterium]|jgi:Tfp pilus assembly protein PilO|nr:GspMb/PilO family protein [Pyrinomonadaceae bacterium]